VGQEVGEKVMLSPYRRRNSRRLASAAFALFCAVSVIVWVRHGAHGTTTDPVVFSMAVQDSEGDVLASPVVVGEPGQTVRVRLVCEADPNQEKMHLTLNPMGVEDGQLLYSYELSVAGHVDQQRGTLKLSMGRERRIHIRPDDQHGVTLSLYAESLRQYLHRHQHAHGRADVEMAVLGSVPA
jgi:hypothetical protein